MIPPDDAELERRGKSLREIDPSSLAPDEDGSQVRWFLGEATTELFAWMRGGLPHHLQLVFGRFSIEWDESSGLQMGGFAAHAATAGGRYDSYLLTEWSAVDAEICRAALVLLRASGEAQVLAAPLVSALESGTIRSPG